MIIKTLNKLYYLLVIFFIFQTNFVKGQIDQDFDSIKDRIFFGGNVGLTFGSVTDIEISPQVGYYITMKWAAGFGIIYEYYKENENFNFETHIYGGTVFTRYFIFPGLSSYFPINDGTSFFIEAEYTGISLEKKYFLYNASPDNEGRYFSHNYFLGGGLMQKISEKSGVYIMVLYHLNENEYSPYQNPIIKVGFSF